MIIFLFYGKHYSYGRRRGEGNKRLSLPFKTLIGVPGMLRAAAVRLRSLRANSPS